jgi:drug/metabolite transporter (DMT)-like permease
MVGNPIHSARNKGWEWITEVFMLSSRKTHVWLPLLTLYIAWGTTYLAIRFAVETIPPFFVAGLRFLLAGLVLVTWRRLAGDPSPSLKQWRTASISGILLLVGGIGGLTLAEKYVPSGMAALIVAATPMWVILLEAIRPGGQPPTPRTMLGVLVGIIGIFLLVGTGKTAINSSGNEFLGVIILIAAGLSWAGGSIYTHNLPTSTAPLLDTGMQLLMGSAGSFLLGLLMGEANSIDLRAISMRSLVGVGYLVIVGSLIGYVCYTWLLRVAPTSLVMTYAYVNPLVAVLLGTLVAGEELTPMVLIATPLILGAVGLIHWHQPVPKPHADPQVSMEAHTGSD